jgi:bifunctional N-acetylglucosamine-1-phosphate-uridyltransferase/glucosamine-1-phosphate-acetyltransferase GlmU-like protein
MEIKRDVIAPQMVQNFRQNEGNDICTVIMQVKNSNFVSDGYNTKLFGKTMTEWVKNSVFDTQIRYAILMPNQDFLQVAKKMINPNAKYTLVLFTDAPLIKRKTILQVINYFKTQDLNVLKLTRGYMFKTEYLLQVDSLYSPQMQYFDEEDFMVCDTQKQLAMISDILKNRILDYFMKNGVEILDPSSTFVDADAQIGSGTVIYPFNQIYGQTIIEPNCTLFAGNTIDDSVICSGSKVQNSIIKNSFVGKDVTIQNYCVIKDNSKIADDFCVPDFCKISSAKIEKDCIIKSFCEYKGEE